MIIALTAALAGIGVGGYIMISGITYIVTAITAGTLTLAAIGTGILTVAAGLAVIHLVTPIAIEAGAALDSLIGI